MWLLFLTTTSEVDMAQDYVARMGLTDFRFSAHLVESLEDYVRTGRPVGSFLEAVISNNLKDAVMFADARNICNLPAFASYMYNNMPAPSQGSRERYRAWVERGGLAGKPGDGDGAG
jgi:hypothetical protein